MTETDTVQRGENFFNLDSDARAGYLIPCMGYPQLQEAYDRACVILEGRSVDELAVAEEAVKEYMKDGGWGVQEFSRWFARAARSDCEPGLEIELHESLALWSILLVQESLATQQMLLRRSDSLTELKRIMKPRVSPSTSLEQALVDFTESLVDGPMTDIAKAHAPYRRTVRASGTYVAGALAISAADAVGAAERIFGELKAHAEETRKRQGASTTANNARHATSREARELVCRDWETEPSRWFSACEAARYYVEWLHRRELKFKQRTVATWIREHAKSKGIRLALTSPSETVRNKR